MDDQFKLKLIDGVYSPDESREILMNVFSSKIQFHQMKNFSSQERFGKDDDSANRRIPQLKDSMDEIQKMIAEAENNSFKIEMKSEVVIRFVKS